ncbi:MAG: hypothetical protein ACPGUZ_03680 [Holosporaceae bacterium]
MSFFFAWDTKEASFDAAKHTRVDLDVLHLTITQSENEPALALVVTPLQDIKAHNKQAFLSIKTSHGDVVCLFRGTLHKNPEKKDAHTLAFTLIAQSPDHPQQLDALLTQHKQSAFYDPLFIAPASENDPRLITLVRPVHFYTDRITHKTTLSSLFEGEKVHDITHAYEQKSFVFKTHKPPLDTLDVTLEVEWIQKAHGFLSLKNPIRRLFPQKAISTFTGKALQKTWPKAGTTLGRSGYWIAASALTQNTRHKPKSTKVWLHKKAHRFCTRLTQSFFDARLVIGWLLNQKRTEKLTFQLRHLYRKKAHTDGTHRTLHLSLKRPLRRLAAEPFWAPYTAYTKGERMQHHNTCYQCTDDHQSSYDFANDTKFWTVTQKWSNALQNANTTSFFLLDRGKKALNYAIDLAKNQMAQSARFVKLSVTLPLEAFHAITTNDSLTLKLPFAPFKHATGKITHYQMIFDGTTGEKTIRVTSALCAGRKPPQKILGDTKNTYCDDYAKDYTHNKHTVFTTPGGLFYNDFKAQVPQDDYAKLTLQPEHHLLQSLKIHNLPAQQEAKARQHASKGQPLPFAQTHTLNTRLSFAFQSLMTTDNTTHHIDLQDPIQWASPQQIEL